ncbi:hypothetical protein K435DRAFT_813538 [Dendrothele bispora CBS 962.96]|uniref:Uncharacterized protein n=1 Tax=Dendrothele bispora (strain CBS 962.96) TaxID=1314807 RepID=A0A4V4HAP9_DENBC|nr:hypothetical protein K435DRAFT_813538 [Dendrothele bispora CBS 962.96]
MSSPTRPSNFAAKIVYRNEKEIGISDPFGRAVLAFTREQVERAIEDDKLFRTGGLPDGRLVTAGGDILARSWNSIPDVTTKFVEIDMDGNLTVPAGRAVAISDILLKHTSDASSKEDQLIALARESMSANDLASTLFGELKYLKNANKKRKEGYAERKRKREVDEANKVTMDAVKAFLADQVDEEEEDKPAERKKAKKSLKGKEKARAATPAQEVAEGSGSGFADSGLDQMEVYDDADGEGDAEDA